MDLKLKYQIYPEFAINDLINCSEDPIDYIVRKARRLISEDSIDLECYIDILKDKFKTLNNLLGIFSDEEIVEGVLRFNLKDLTKIDIYKEFKHTYADDEYIVVEVNAEIDLNVFKILYDRYIKIEIRE